MAEPNASSESAEVLEALENHITELHEEWKVLLALFASDSAELLMSPQAL
jgi:hypothetical protein